MNIFLLKSKANYFQSLLPNNEAAWDIFANFKGLPIRETWQPIYVEIAKDSINLPASDFPLLINHVPVFSDRATEILMDLLEPNGELLPLQCSEGNYFAFNILNVIDALDIEKSSCVYFSSGRIMDIKSYTLFAEKLVGQHIFKLPQTPTMDVFVSDLFVKRVKMHELMGFSFKEISLA